MKRPKDGIINSKLTPYEMLQHAILVQAVSDIKTTNGTNCHWMECTVHTKRELKRCNTLCYY